MNRVFPTPMNVVTLLKGEQRFVFLFDNVSLTEAIQMAKRYAADPEFLFNWYDASVVIRIMRSLVK